MEKRLGILRLLNLVPIFLLINAQPLPTSQFPSVLALTAAAGWKHDSIPNATALIRTHASNRGWNLTISSSASEHFNSSASLNVFDVIIMLLTSGDVFNVQQQIEFETYVRQGGAVVGVHSALDTHRDWPFYRDLFGAILEGHPAVQRGILVRQDANHSTSRFLPPQWEVREEFYNFAEPFGWEEKHVLLTVDGTSYQGGAHGEFHPVSWCRSVSPSMGRIWVTALGHTREVYASHEGWARLFQGHLALGVEWAANGTSAARIRWRRAMAENNV